MKTKSFKTDKGFLLPVNEKKYLIPFLTGTTKGTKYYDPAPSNVIKKEYLADKLLQLHQFIDIFLSIGVNLKNKSFLDVGTGNGLIPKSLLLTGYSKNVLGTDLYEPYEHESASIPLEKQALWKFLNFFKKAIKKHKLSYKSYKKYLKQTAEGEVFEPSEIKIEKFNLQNLKKYRFKKFGAHDLNKIKKKFDIIYCKGIEHIPDWKLVVKNFSSVSKKDTFIYLKIRPFNSYLGPHRFATTAIPWGHVLLKENEYERYVKKFHKNRAKKMMKSYYTTLTYPRCSIEELIRLFESSNFSLYSSKLETPPYLKEIFNFKKKISKFDYLNKNNKNISNTELYSSAQHLVFRKISK